MVFHESSVGCSRRKYWSTASAVSACTSTIQITPCGESQKYALKTAWFVNQKTRNSTTPTSAWKMIALTGLLCTGCVFPNQSGSTPSRPSE